MFRALCNRFGSLFCCCFWVVVKSSFMSSTKWKVFWGSGPNFFRAIHVRFLLARTNDSSFLVKKFWSWNVPGSGPRTKTALIIFVSDSKSFPYSTLHKVTTSQGKLIYDMRTITPSFLVDHKLKCINKIRESVREPKPEWYRTDSLANRVRWCSLCNTRKRRKLLKTCGCVCLVAKYPSTIAHNCL